MIFSHKLINDKMINERKPFSFVEFIENWEHFKAYWDQLCKCYRLKSEKTVMKYKDYVENDIDDAKPFFEFWVDLLELDSKPAKKIVLSSLLKEA